MTRHVLLVDDCPAKMAEMRAAATAADPRVVLHEAENVREALAAIDAFGKDIDEGGIDFDLPDGTGAQVISALHRESRGNARGVLYTARQGEAFHAAAADALGSGADAAYSAQESPASVLFRTQTGAP